MWLFNYKLNNNRQDNNRKSERNEINLEFLFTYKRAAFHPCPYSIIIDDKLKHTAIDRSIGAYDEDDDNDGNSLYIVS